MNFQKSKKYSRGIALIVVLMFTFLITGLIMENAFRTNIDLDLLTSSRAYLQSYSLAQGGINYGLSILSKDDDINCDWLGEEWAKGPFELKVEEGNVKVLIEDEMGKINLNKIGDARGKEKRDRIEQLLEICDFLDTPYSFVPSLIDWIDEDKEVTVLPFITGENSGAEDNYYTSLNNPYHVKNMQIEVPEEILWIKGMSKDSWEGKEGEKGWKDLITLWGNGKVNLNTCSFPVLKATLQVYSSEAIDDSVVKEIIEIRKTQPFTKVDDFSPYFSRKLISRLRRSKLIGFSSSLFSIKVSSDVENVKVAINSVWMRKNGKFRVKYIKVE